MDVDTYDGNGAAARNGATIGIGALLMILATIVPNAALAEVAPGQWVGGDRATETPFFICLHVSEDGNRLTALNTTCRGNQGNNQNSLSKSLPSSIR